MSAGGGGEGRSRWCEGRSRWCEDEGEQTHGPAGSTIEWCPGLVVDQPWALNRWDRPHLWEPSSLRRASPPAQWALRGGPTSRWSGSCFWAAVGLKDCFSEGQAAARWRSYVLPGHRQHVGSRILKGYYRSTQQRVESRTPACSHSVGLAWLNRRGAYPRSSGAGHPSKLFRTLTTA